MVETQLQHFWKPWQRTVSATQLLAGQVIWKTTIKRVVPRLNDGKTTRASAPRVTDKPEGRISPSCVCEEPPKML